MAWVAVLVLASLAILTKEVIPYEKLLNNEKYAAWAQAFFSVVAIVVAIVVSSHQTKQTRDAGTQALADRISAIARMCVAAKDAIQDLATERRLGNEEGAIFTRSLVRSMHTHFQQVRLDQLPGEVGVTAVVTASSALHDAHFIADGFELDRPMGTAEERFYQRYVERIEEQILQLRIEAQRVLDGLQLRTAANVQGDDAARREGRTKE